MTQSVARPRQTAALPDLLRAEGSKSCRSRPDDAPRAAAEPAADGAPPTRQHALAAALYDLVTNRRHPPSARVAAARLILEYCAGRPAQVQVSIAQDHPCKTYVVISPDDWPQ